MGKGQERRAEGKGVKNIVNKNEGRNKQKGVEYIADRGRRRQSSREEESAKGREQEKGTKT